MIDKKFQNGFAKRACDDVPTERQCLRCKSMFWSIGFGERICQKCKSSYAWRTAQ